ncbi:hypothetical protein [Rhizobium lentis]|uniref:Uncharacterized protein n=1 Tax=Rhizobium lentis TaxID=1138194 RepID=A0A9Q3MAG1_9HYPH|nr:hypothetical protein [Rhizobium lentis]MBX4957792.1 hypothetical protein [Rhizobium lentis]MBX4975722.1 hypothetical protein [Rhizobium lentis]MBX4987780.1 hypothetical protein [Rhizobium lentis]MBX5000407.1 hypothetical protein [Rhizobium lentis]MBX5006227.1 hypothetical protein [Rhizobium lentis]
MGAIGAAAGVAQLLGASEELLSTQAHREKFDDCLKWGNRQPSCDLYARVRRLNEAADLWTAWYGEPPGS